MKKNIFLLQTRETSVLSMAYLSNPMYLRYNRSGFIYDAFRSNDNRYMYIISNNEPKLDEWGISTANDILFKSKGFASDEHSKNYCRKVILSTDPKLIREGVQEIKEDFLEWIVKNPGCEFVEVVPLMSNNQIALFGYKLVFASDEIADKKELLLKAYQEGKTIQSSHHGKHWEDFSAQNQLDRPNFDYGHINSWRIKPEISSVREKIKPLQEFFQKLREEVVKTRPEKYSERFDKKLSLEENVETWGKRVVEEGRYVKCGEANKFYQCINCGENCGTEGHFVEKTVEEAATRFSRQALLVTARDGFVKGVAWEKERSYSREEVLRFASTVLSQYKVGNTNIEQPQLLKETLNLFSTK